MKLLSIVTILAAITPHSCDAVDLVTRRRSEARKKSMKQKKASRRENQRTNNLRRALVEAASLSLSIDFDPTPVDEADDATPVDPHSNDNVALIFGSTRRRNLEEKAGRH